MNSGNTLVSTEPKCPGCKGPYNIIDETCLECMKRLHWYLYNTQEGMRFTYDNKERRIKRMY